MVGGAAGGYTANYVSFAICHFETNLHISGQRSTKGFFQRSGYQSGVPTLNVMTLPDVLEPALSSWHRNVAHSCTAGAAIVYSKDALLQFEKFCREQADLCALQHKTLQMRPDPWQPNVFVPAPADPFMLLSLKIAEMFWRFLAGFANGLAAGYISHLALDAVTPRSIPLFGKM